MIAMILAAGRGERMRPLTDSCPKPLIKVNGIALIEYHILSLIKAGVTKIVINHAWLGEQIEAALGYGEKWGINITYSAEKEGLETAGGIVKALLNKQLTDENNQHFIVVNGDIFTDYDFSNLLTLTPKTLAHLVMVSNPEHHLNGDFYLYQESISTDKIEGSLQPKLTFSGIALYHEDFFKGLSLEKKPLAPLLVKAMQQKKVSGEYYNGIWSDVGTVERLNSLETFLAIKSE